MLLKLLLLPLILLDLLCSSLLVLLTFVDDEEEAVVVEEMVFDVIEVLVLLLLLTDLVAVTAVADLFLVAAVSDFADAETEDEVVSVATAEFPDSKPLTPSPASSSPSSPTAGALGLLACSKKPALTDGFGSVAGGAAPFAGAASLGRDASADPGFCFLATVGGGDFGFLNSAAGSSEGFLADSFWSPFASSSGLFLALAFRTVFACRPIPSFGE